LTQTNEPGLITYCVPCVTFGKTHHRTRKDANMAGYEPINTSVRTFFTLQRAPF
jgi:hypothetical protein